MARRSKSTRRTPPAARQPPGAPRSAGPRAIAAVAGLLAAGLVVRLLGGRGDLWLDEILSVDLARMVPSSWALVSTPDAYTDNNHLLNSFWLHATAAQTHPLVQRLHSILAGAASVALAFAFARRWGTATALVAAALFSGSFVMIHYGSEARGYAMLVAFTLLALVALDRWHERSSTGWLIIFWAASLLALLSHITFLQVLLAAFVWSAWRLWRRATPARRAAVLLPAAFGVPLAFSGILYLGFFRHITILGGPDTVITDIVRDTAAYVLGLPRGGGWAGAALAAAAALLVAAVRVLHRRKDEAWVLLGMLCAGAPAAMILAVPPSFMAPRYFIISVTGLLLAIAVVLGHIFDGSRNGRLASLAMLAALLAANSVDTSRLLVDGRGQYSRALREMAAESPSPLLRIGGDHAFRQPFVIRYHQSGLPPGRAAQYVTDDQYFKIAPEWVVLHSFDPERDPPPAEVRDPMGRVYLPFSTYPSGPLSGWHWYVYRLQS